MVCKFTLLLVVIAIFAASIWMTAAPTMAERHAQSDWLMKRLDAHRHFESARMMGDVARERSGDAPADQNAIRRLYDQCGSY